MPLVLELGAIRDPPTRRAFEQLILQIPGLVTVSGGGGGPETDPVAGPALATHAALTTGAHGGIVASSDPRLTDARTPTAHKTTHEPGGSDAMTVDAAAATGSLRTLGTGATQALPGNHASTTNARTPTAHATTHQPGGSDAMAVDAAAATGSLRTLGTGAAQAAAGNDARLSDARTPTAHTHPAADIVSGTMATARLGSGTADGTTFLRGDQTWAAVAAPGVISSPWVAVVSQAADVTVATTTNTNTDLVFNFDANSTYIIDLYLMTTSAAATTGVAFAWDTSVAVTNANLTFEHQLAVAGTISGGDAVADDTVRGISSGVPDTGITPIIGMGIVRTGANAGTCRLRFRPEVAASATFKAGSTMRVMKVGASTSGITVVTSLPGSPADGQEVYYVADATNRVLWHLRYNAAGGTYKWEFLGGSRLRSQITGPVAFSSPAAFAWNTLPSGPSVTAPLAGEYEVDWNAVLTTTSVATLDFRIKANLVTAYNIPSGGGIQGGGGVINPKGSSVQTATASQSVFLQYATSSASMAVTLYDTALWLRPVRVS